MAALGVLAVLAFALAYSQSPLFTSNQNQYFLHGAARAGLGHLGQDWLANTADPTPVFSWMVEWTLRLLPSAAFHLEYVILFGVYLAGQWWLADSVFRLNASARRSLLFLTLVVLLHSLALRFIQRSLLGDAWEYLWDGGVAGQRLLGPVLQPSSFGVFLLLSMGLFAQGRTAWACVAAAAAALIHPTYLLPAAILVLTYCLLLWREAHNLRRPIACGLLAMVLVAPMVVYVVTALGPTGAEEFAEAQRILVEERVPHHAVPAAWFDATALFKLALLGLAWLATRRTRVGRTLALAAAAGLILTFIQILSHSDTLALLFPWRISTVLVPASTGVLCGWTARRLAEDDRTARTWRRRMGTIVCVMTLLGLSLAGAFAFHLQRMDLQAHPAAGVFAYVREHARSGEVYLIPASLQEFRLATGAPAFVDRKAIPYRDRYVLQWHERLALVNRVYREEPQEVDCGLLSMLAEQYGVTHVVLDEDILDLACPPARIEYRDTRYAVLALPGP